MAGADMRRIRRAGEHDLLAHNCGSFASDETVLAWEAEVGRRLGPCAARRSARLMLYASFAIDADAAAEFALSVLTQSGPEPASRVLGVLAAWLEGVGAQRARHRRLCGLAVQATRRLHEQHARLRHLDDALRLAIRPDLLRLHVNQRARLALVSTRGRAGGGRDGVGCAVGAGSSAREPDVPGAVAGFDASCPHAALAQAAYHSLAAHTEASRRMEQSACAAVDASIELEAAVESDVAALDAAPQVPLVEADGGAPSAVCGAGMAAVSGLPGVGGAVAPGALPRAAGSRQPQGSLGPLESVLSRRALREQALKQRIRRERTALLQTRVRVRAAREEAERQLREATEEVSRARSATARARAAAEAAAVRAERHMDALTADNAINMARRRVREVEASRGGRKSGPCAAERGARAYGAALQAGGSSPGSVGLPALDDDHMRRLFTARRRADPALDQQAASALNAGEYDAFLERTLAVPSEPRRFHVHLGAGCFGTGRGLAAAKGLGSVEVSIESDPRVCALRASLAHTGPRVAPSKLPTGATATAALRGSFTRRGDVTAVCTRLKRALAAAREAGRESSRTASQRCSCDDFVLWASGNCAPYSRRAAAADCRGSTNDGDLMPIIEEVAKATLPLVAVVEQVVGMLDHEDTLRRFVQRLQRQFYVVIDAVCASHAGAVSEQHHLVIFLLRRDRFRPLAARGYRALLEAVRAAPLPGTPDAVLAHVCVAKRARGVEGPASYDMFSNPGGAILASERCALRGMLTACRDARALGILTPYDKLPKVTRGSLCAGDGQQLLLQQSDLPTSAPLLASVRPIPLQMLLRAQSFPRAEAATLETAARRVWSRGDSPIHQAVANLFPPVLAASLGRAIDGLLATSTCARCGSRGCGACGVPGARVAASAFAHAFGP